MLGAYMLAAAVTQLMWLTYAPITSKVQRLTGASELKIVALALIFPLLYVPVSIPVGILVDRKGFRASVLLGISLTAGFSLLRLFAGTYPLVLAGMVGMAVGQPFVLNSVTKLVATWFPSEESGLATGLGAVSVFLGMIAALVAGPRLLEVFGASGTGAVRGVALVYSIAALAGVAIFAALAKARPAVPPRRVERDQGGGEPIRLRSLGEVTRAPNFRLLCLGTVIGNGSFVGIVQLLEKILAPKGISSSSAGDVGAAMILAGVVGCAVIPPISDRVGRRKPFLVAAPVVAMAAILGVAAADRARLVLLAAVVLGFFAFSAYPIMLALSEESVGARLTGMMTSVLAMLANAGGVVMTLVMEGIKEATGGPKGSFSWSLVFVVCLFGVATVAASRLRERAPGPLVEDARA